MPKRLKRRSVGVCADASVGATPFLASLYWCDAIRGVVVLVFTPTKTLGQDCPSHCSTDIPVRAQTLGQDCPSHRSVASASPPTNNTGATPFLASQSIPTNELRLDTNVQATRAQVRRLSWRRKASCQRTTLGHKCPNHLERPADGFCDDRNVVAPVLASQSVLPTTHAWTRMYKPRQPTHTPHCATPRRNAHTTASKVVPTPNFARTLANSLCTVRTLTLSRCAARWASPQSAIACKHSRSRTLKQSSYGSHWEIYFYEASAERAGWEE